MITKKGQGLFIHLLVQVLLCVSESKEFFLLHNFLSLLGGAPSPGNATNHNHATAVTGVAVIGSGGSNFKRQNTVDAATIKENSARVSANRPSAPKNSQPPGQLDTSEFILFLNKTLRTSYQRIYYYSIVCHAMFTLWCFSEKILFLDEVALNKVAVFPPVANIYQVYN